MYILGGPFLPRTVHSMLKHMIPILRISTLRSAVIDKIGLKEMGTFRWEGRGKGLPCWLSQFSFAKHGRLFSLPSQRNFLISFKPIVAITKFIWELQKKVSYYEKWVGHHASFPLRRSVWAEQPATYCKVPSSNTSCFEAHA